MGNHIRDTKENIYNLANNQNQRRNAIFINTSNFNTRTINNNIYSNINTFNNRNDNIQQSTIDWYNNYQRRTNNLSNNYSLPQEIIDWQNRRFNLPR